MATFKAILTLMLVLYSVADEAINANDPMECTFEETDLQFCGWKNLNSSDFDWSLGQGATETDGTGPSTDHTLQDAYGKYLYLNTSNDIETGAIAHIESPWYFPSSRGGICFQFWYHMYGDGIGTLQLYTVVDDDLFPVVLQWSKSSNQGNTWLIGQTSFDQFSGKFKIRFSATKGSSLKGNIALDDFHMYDGPCNDRATCDFENEKCTWRNTILEDDRDWIVGNGRKPATKLGPLVDHTKNTEFGNYIYMDTNAAIGKAKKARLESEQISFKYDTLFCLKFWYQMRGANIGKLDLYVKSEEGSTKEKLIWTLSGNQGDKWQEASAPINTVQHSKHHFQMVFEGIYGGNHNNGSIALDDIVFLEYSCHHQPEIAKPKVVSTPKPVTTLEPSTKPIFSDCCKVESMGCFKDSSDRALPELLLGGKEVDPSFDGRKPIDWKHYAKFLKMFTCRCAEIAKKKGYNVIGLQFYGECWSGPYGHLTYDKHGPTSDCINGEFDKYNNATCELQVGKQWANSVYRVSTLGCKEDFEPVGCFHDEGINPRPLPQYILNERDYRHAHWNGRLVDWGNWFNYVPGMICRCATRAIQLGHTYFALQFWGECWSGPNAKIDYAKDGNSTFCRNENFMECPCNSYHCVGRAKTNYVYKVKRNETCEA